MPLPRRAIDVSPPYRNRLFQSDERVDSHSHVAREPAEHSLKWKRGAVSAAMFKANLNRLRMYVLRYGAEVEVPWADSLPTTASGSTNRRTRPGERPRQRASV